jgi:hypothetical protein
VSLYERNDGRFPDESDVEVRHPLTRHHAKTDRTGWPWVPGYIAGQCGPDEWDVVVTGAAPSGYDSDGEPLFPMVFRDATEIRAAVTR